MDKFHIFGQISMSSLIFYEFSRILVYFNELPPHAGGAKEIAMHTFLVVYVCVSGLVSLKTFFENEIVQIKITKIGYLIRKR